MNRPSKRSRNRTFYVGAQGTPDAGIVDRYGRIYMVLKTGALKLIKDIATGADDPRRRIGR